MSKFFNTPKSRNFLFIILIAAALVRFWLAWQPVEVLVLKNLPDDSFYYFQLAHNLAHHGSVTVDGSSPTNGFHPLWLLTITPIFKWFPQPLDLPIHLTLSLSALIDVASVVLIAVLASRLTGRWQLGLIAAGLYAFNPLVILQSMNGLETGLGILTALFFLLAVTRFADEPGRRQAALAGAAGGLMLLARSDALFLFGCVLIAGFYVLPRQSRIVQLAIMSGCALLLMLPWFVWSYAQVGSIVQESGLAVPFALHARAGLESPLAETVRQLSDPIGWLRGDFTGLPLALGGLLWLAVLVALFRHRAKLTPSQLIVLIPLLISGLLMILFHAGLRWYPRPWYFVPISLAFAFCAASLLGGWLEKRNLAWLGVIMAVYFAFSGFLFWKVGLYPWQGEMWSAKAWLGEHVGQHQTVASFNSGIYSYYNTFRVINLDGVVNHNAYQAVRARNLLSYMQQQDVDFLIDTDRAINTEYAPFMGEGFPAGLKEYEVLFPDLGFDLGALRVYELAESN